MNSSKKLIKRIFYLLLIWFISHILYTIIDGCYDAKKTADVAVILGNKVNEDGSLSLRLEKRMECGLELFLDNRVNKIIVSGGLGKEGYFEGDKMREYLLRNGVADSCIIVDNQGNNTRATVLNSLKIKDSLNLKSILIVSQYYHITRIKKLYRNNGFTTINSSSPRFFEFRDIYSLLREFAAFYLG